MLHTVLISIPERTQRQFTGKYLEVTPQAALTRITDQISARPIPLPIQHYETAEMILVYAQRMSVADANKLAQAFGPYPTVDALRTAIPDIEANMYQEV